SAGGYAGHLRRKNRACCFHENDWGKWGKSPGELGDRPRRSAVGRQKMAEFRALRSDFERMLHLRARTFAPLTDWVGNP
ncbi:MAG: hypothetical protein ACJ8AW_53000, partial [Rhodopila sp.]